MLNSKVSQKLNRELTAAINILIDMSNPDAIEYCLKNNIKDDVYVDILDLLGVLDKYPIKR